MKVALEPLAVGAGINLHPVAVCLALLYLERDFKAICRLLRGD